METTNNRKPREKLPFREYLDKSANLITIFGVFNALSIYSTTIENKNVTGYLLPSFFLLSLVVWYELLSFAHESDDGSRKYSIYTYLLFIIEIHLTIFFIYKFTSLALLITTIVLLGVYIYLCGRFLSFILSKWLEKQSDKVDKIMSYVIIVLSLVFAFFILKLTSPYVQSFIKDYVAKDFLYKSIAK